jgi:hypothetical protein
MKKGFLFLLLVSAITTTTQAQSLKDLLYSGKLKKDSGEVVRKTDDLSKKIDTGQKKVVDSNKTKIATTTADSMKKTANHSVDSAGGLVETKDAVTPSETVPVKKAPVKSNTKLWKEYSDSLTKELNTEVLTSKKIKKGTYFILIEYELHPDNKVNVVNVTSSPENDLLVAQLKVRMDTTVPALNADANQTKRVKKKYSFTITKE